MHYCKDEILSSGIHFDFGVCEGDPERDLCSSDETEGSEVEIKRNERSAVQQPQVVIKNPIHMYWSEKNNIFLER